MESTIRKITLHSQEIRKDKQVFIASSAEINKKWFKIKFTKECINAPKVKGLYDLTIDFDDCSIEKGKPYVKSDGKKAVSNDTIWVRKIVEIHQYSEEDLKVANRLAMSELFGG